MPDVSMGACLVANDLPSLGKEIIERRVQGQSWKQIGEDLGIGSPGTARRTFKKLTGISDFKTKGSAIKAIAKQVGFLDDAGEIAVKQAIKSTADDVTKAIAGKIDKTLARIDIDDVKATRNKLDDVFGKSKADQVRSLADNGVGYTKIAQQVGLDIKDIDDIVWNHTLEKNGGHVWKAYEKKATSQSGGNAVKKLVNDLRAKGISIDDIADATDIPKTVVQAITKGEWKIPTTAGAGPVVPPPPPAPPKTSRLPDLDDLFQRGTHQEMSKWAKDLGFDLSADERAAFSSYTGSGYQRINQALRSKRSSAYVKNLDSGMRPMPFDRTVVRNVSEATFHGMGVRTVEDAHSLLGKVFKEDGYLSTSVRAPHGVFSQHKYRIEIQVPQGTPARYVSEAGRPLSSQGSGEEELIIGRDLSMVVEAVEDFFENGVKKVLLRTRILV